MEKTQSFPFENKKLLDALKSTVFYFFLGGTVYSLIEIAWRGYTHWTMTLLGGLVVVILKKIDDAFSEAPLIFKCTVGTAIITILELLAGLIINRRHSLGVWSYDTVPYNILGQICPIYTFYWFLLCIAAFYLFRFIDQIRA